MRARSRTIARSIANSHAMLPAGPAPADEELAAYCRDLDQWPRSWMYEERDVSPGGQRPRASQYRPTRWLSCVAIWSAVGWSVIRFGRSRMLAWSVSSMRPVMDHTPWCACWRG